MRAIPDSVAADRAGRLAGPLWDERAAQVANAGGVAALRIFSRFFLDFIGLYANLARVKIRLTGPDGKGAKMGFPQTTPHAIQANPNQSKSTQVIQPKKWKQRA